MMLPAPRVSWLAIPRALCALALVQAAAAEEVPAHLKDVIYGRKHGMALTMDVFKPEHPNGASIIWVVSGGWVSSHDTIEAAGPLSPTKEFTDRGYTVFAVVHGSQPKYTIPEILLDMHRATRYIRAHSNEYGVDSNRIGITGASAGGHLSLMQGMAGDNGDPAAKDEVDRQSSRVQAVACFFPPTDFLNYGQPDQVALGDGTLAAFPAPFAFEKLDQSVSRFGRYVAIEDEGERRAIGQAISPINHVSHDDPPTLIIHGDADKLVPIQQAELIIDKLTQSNVEAKLVVKPGAQHGWPGMADDMSTIADWFDAHLSRSP